MKKILYFAISLILVSFAAGCTKTVKDIVTTNDTIISNIHKKDSSGNYVSKKDSVIIIKTDTVYKSKTDTVYEVKYKQDSIWVRDSIFVKEKNDTVFYYKEKWNTKIIQLRDTVYKSKTDTVYRVKSDTVYKEKNDTVVIYRFIERDSSTYQSSDKSEVKVKKKLSLKGWILYPLIILMIGAAVIFIMKFIRKN